jgi:hypothetical protein
VKVEPLDAVQIKEGIFSHPGSRIRIPGSKKHSGSATLQHTKDRVVEVEPLDAVKALEGIFPHPGSRIRIPGSQKALDLGSRIQKTIAHRGQSCGS